MKSFTQHGVVMQRLALVMIGTLVALPIAAQTPAQDPSTRLEQVLPPDVAAQVLQHIADARRRELPAAALEHRALELAAKGAEPANIERFIATQEGAMAVGKQALQAAGRHPDDDEVDAAGTAVDKGVDGAAVSALANSAPSGRSLAVPLAVIASLVDCGLPSDEALKQVLARLQAHASDQELQQPPEQAGQGLAHKPVGAGTPSASPPSSVVAGRPAWVPANGGSQTRPATPILPSKHP